MYRKNVHSSEELETVASIDGKLLPYDCCANNQEAEKTSYGCLKLKYLGKGFIYSIDGVVQHYAGTPEMLHFWAKR